MHSINFKAASWLCIGACLQAKHSPVLQAANYLQDEVTATSCGWHLARPLLSAVDANKTIAFMELHPEPIAVAILRHCKHRLGPLINKLPHSLHVAATRAACCDSEYGLHLNLHRLCDTDAGCTAAAHIAHHVLPVLQDLQSIELPRHCGPFGSAPFPAYLLAALPQARNLQHVVCHADPVPESLGEAVSQALPSMARLQALEVHQRWHKAAIASRCGICVIGVLSKLRQLANLTFVNVQMTISKEVELRGTLGGLTALTSLSLVYRSACAQRGFVCSGTLTRLQRLSLHWTHMPAQGAARIDEPVRALTGLTELCLKGSVASVHDVEEIVRCLQDLRALVRLQLTIRVGVDLTADSRVKLFDLLWEQAPQLEHLVVPWLAYGGQEVTEQVASAFLRGPALQSLSLGACTTQAEWHWAPSSAELVTVMTALRERAAGGALRELIFYRSDEGAQDWGRIASGQPVNGVSVSLRTRV